MGRRAIRPISMWCVLLLPEQLLSAPDEILDLLLPHAFLSSTLGGAQSQTAPSPPHAIILVDQIDISCVLVGEQQVHRHFISITKAQYSSLIVLLRYFELEVLDEGGPEVFQETIVVQTDFHDFHSFIIFKFSFERVYPRFHIVESPSERQPNELDVTSLINWNLHWLRIQIEAFYYREGQWIVGGKQGRVWLEHSAIDLVRQGVVVRQNSLMITTVVFFIGGPCG
mmetsp:Transcript_24668/g.45978  ORF Transcript_24668/g.45978 Transcript_24668/m.45978 type:complete len:226 (+) Transcript_24668:105-782(+)